MHVNNLKTSIMEDMTIRVLLHLLGQLQKIFLLSKQVNLLTSTCGYCTCFRARMSFF